LLQVEGDEWRQGSDNKDKFESEQAQLSRKFRVRNQTGGYQHVAPQGSSS
jgi:hypothetical protein